MQTIVPGTAAPLYTGDGHISREYMNAQSLDSLYSDTPLITEKEG